MLPRTSTAITPDDNGDSQGSWAERIEAVKLDVLFSSGRTWTIETMAWQAGCSIRTFQRKFKTIEGLPPKQWLDKVRVNRAKFLLDQTDYSVDSIAQAVGFNDSAALRYQFRLHLSKSPSTYREKHRTHLHKEGLNQVPPVR